MVRNSILYVSILWLLQITACQTIQSFNIRTDEPVRAVDKRFLSIAIGVNTVRHGWPGLTVNDRVLTLARGLQPAYLRIGGTAADFLIFDNNASIPTVSYDGDMLLGDPMNNFTVNRHDLDKIHKLAAQAGWDVIFDLNVLLRTEDGSWNSSNPLEIMQYARDHDYDFKWQLGNEPNHFGKFNRSISAAQLGQDFSKLRKILDDDPSLGDTIVGPDVDTLEDKKPRLYLAGFLENGGTSVDAVTWHQYYVDGRTSTIDDFYSASILDRLVKQLNDVNNIVVSRAPQIQRWMGETSSAYGGGAPGLSDRYVAGFMWLDKLGLAARLGQSVVIRQTFFGGRYALLDMDLNPTPDYWLSVLYKRLVGAEVLEVDNSLEKGRIVRVYAHCTNLRLSKYKPGAITVIAMNIDPSTEATFNLTGDLKGLTIDQYLLTPSNGDPTSQFVMLNGKVLKLINDNTLPDLDPRKITSDKIVMPPLSMALFVIPEANASACKNTLV